MKRARADLIGSGRALLAFQQGEDSDEALLGACITAEVYGLIRAFLTKKK